MLLIVVIEAIQARRQYRNNERSSCHNNGGSCEPMFGCILKQGYMSGSCAGFLQVCCIQPTFVSRRFKDNFIFDAGPPVSFFMKKKSAFFLITESMIVLSLASFYFLTIKQQNH